MTTSVLCLKGRLREWGPSLEHAPAGHLYVGRRMTMGGWRLPQSVWANPFSVKKSGGATCAVTGYWMWLLADEQTPLRERIVPELRGKTLLCWCKTGPCHAVLLATWADTGVPEIGSTTYSRVTTPPTRRAWETIRPRGEWAGAL